MKLHYEQSHKKIVCQVSMSNFPKIWMFNQMIINFLLPLPHAPWIMKLFVTCHAPTNAKCDNHKWMIESDVMKNIFCSSKLNNIFRLLFLAEQSQNITGEEQRLNPDSNLRHLHKLFDEEGWSNMSRSYVTKEFKNELVTAHFNQLDGSLQMWWHIQRIKHCDTYF